MFPLITIISVLIATIFAEDRDVCHGGERKFYPGFTVAENDGQFLKFIGPIYGKIDIVGKINLPIKMSDYFNVSFLITPTTEIYSLFAVGNLKHKGIPWVIFDGDEDLCMSRGTECPFPRCLPKKQAYRFFIKDVGLLPGLYTGKINLFSYNDKYEKYHIAGAELKFNIIE